MKKLLIVDNIRKNTAFLDNFNKNFYKGWDIIVIGNPFGNNVINFYSGSLTSLLKEVVNKQDVYSHFLIINSDSYFCTNYNLDLVTDVLTFPIITDQSNVENFSDVFQGNVSLRNNLKYKLIRIGVLTTENYINRAWPFQFINYIFIKKKILPIIVDYVFPFVDNNDPTWFKDYTFYKQQDEDRINEFTSKDTRFVKNYATGLQRFRSNGILKYTFRSIEKNLPFINKVHMLVAGPGQVPKWVDTKEVDIIYHEEFMPKDLLPTFSSSEIEMFLPKLPRVTEHFIYGNDDTLIMKKQILKYWFLNNKPVSFINVRPVKDTFAGDIFRRNDYLLVAPKDFPIIKDTCIDTQHCPEPYRLSLMQECYEKYEKEILSSCTRFREDNKNYNQYIWQGYNFFNNNLYLKKRKRLTMSLENINDSTNLQDYSTICVNDSNEYLYEDNLKLLLNKLQNIFPEKSKYEKD